MFEVLSFTTWLYFHQKVKPNNHGDIMGRSLEFQFYTTRRTLLSWQSQRRKLSCVNLGQLFARLHKDSSLNPSHRVKSKVSRLSRCLTDQIVEAMFRYVTTVLKAHCPVDFFETWSTNFKDTVIDASTASKTQTFKLLKLWRFSFQEYFCHFRAAS